MSPSKTIKQAEARCRAAFAKYPKAKYAWCCHHEVFFEPLTEPATNRIEFILENKSQSEQITRLDNFRPVRNEKVFAPLYADYQAKRAPLYADYQAKCDALYADYQAKPDALFHQFKKLYKQDVLMGTWNGKSIFKK